MSRSKAERVPCTRRPGHGADDFHTGLTYGLEIYAPVGAAGHFLDTVELFGGMRVFDANPKVQEALAARGQLWRAQQFRTSILTAGAVTTR